MKVNVSYSLIAVGAEGVRVPLYLGHSWAPWIDICNKTNTGNAWLDVNNVYK